MQPLHVITPLGEFPDPLVARSAEELRLNLVANTSAAGDGLRELSFRNDTGDEVHYLYEPHLGIPFLLIFGPDGGGLARRLTELIPNLPAEEIIARWSREDPADRRAGTMRMLAVHAMGGCSDRMLSIAASAATDPTAYIRMAVILMAQYGRDGRLTDLIRPLLADPEPEVRSYAATALAQLDD